MKYTSGITVRDSLRSEVSKQRQTDSELREKREQQRMEISKLEILIKQAEQQMVNLRKRYESEVKKRNDRYQFCRLSVIIFRPRNPYAEIPVFGYLN